MKYINYLSNIKLPKVLSEEKTLEYFKLAASGDLNARETLIIHNLKLVLLIINRRYSNAGDIDNLTGLGIIGLIKAVDTFNVDKNIKFSTYASRCIINEILMSFRRKKNSPIIESNINDYRGNEKNIEEILSKAEDSSRYSSGFYELIEYEEEYEMLRQTLDVLDERSRKIILMRYGFQGIPKTQQEVANEFNLSRSSISKIEKSALELLRQQLCEINPNFKILTLKPIKKNT